MRRKRFIAFALLASCSLTASPTPAPTPRALARPAVAQPAAAQPALAQPALAQPAAPAARPTVAAGVSYVARETGGAGADERLPLIVAVHGLGDRPDAFLELFDALPFRARVVAVRGLDPFYDGFAWFPIGGAEADAAPFRRAVDALSAAIPEIARQRPTCGLPVITGFSQGGMLSFAIAVRAPSIVRGAVPIAGRLPAALLPAPRPVGGLLPTITALHGTADARIPYAQGEGTVRALRARGFPAELRTFEGVGHAVPGAVRAALVEALQRLTQGGC